MVMKPTIFLMTLALLGVVAGPAFSDDHHHHNNNDSNYSWWGKSKNDGPPVAKGDHEGFKWDSQKKQQKTNDKQIWDDGHSSKWYKSNRSNNYFWDNQHHD